MTFDETTPLEEILKALPQDEIDELSALGDTRDDTRWRIGDIARRWIDDEGMPVNQICKLIGKLNKLEDIWFLNDGRGRPSLPLDIANSQ